MGGSSYRGFGLPGVDCITRSNDSHSCIIAIYLQVIHRSAIGQFFFSVPNNNPASSLRKKLTFGNVTTGFPAKWHLRNDGTNPILMTRHYPDLGSASDWLNQLSHGMINQKHHPDPIISMECLHSFLRRYLVGKPMVVSPLKCQLFSPAIQEVFVKVNSAQFNPSGFLSA